MLPDNFYGFKVIAIYRCGSRILGVESSESDEDYTVILGDYHGSGVEKQEGTDFFLFGIEDYKKATQIEDGILPYFTIWIDNVLLAQRNLVYIEPDFKNQFEEIINAPWPEERIKKWVKSNVDYFRAFYFGGGNEKSLYNLYRVRSLIAHYKRTGRFEAFLSKKDKELILDYKVKKQNLEIHKKNFEAIFAYLESFISTGGTS
jgi:hypothetical protein